MNSANSQPNQRSIESQVASRTGEDLATIQNMGFTLLGPNRIEERDEPLLVDWDLVDASR